MADSAPEGPATIAAVEAESGVEGVGPRACAGREEVMAESGVEKVGPRACAGREEVMSDREKWED